MATLPNYSNSRRARQEAARIPKNGLYMGSNIEDSTDVYLNLDWLKTHLHVLGLTGVGKSRLLFWLFQLLCQVRNATVIVIDPKGGKSSLYEMCRNWAMGYGHTKRLTLFDATDPDVVAGYNPLHPNGLPIPTHVKTMREAIRSAAGQSSFDQTPQLARFLYLALYIVRELGLSLLDAVELLTPDSPYRDRVIPQIKDPYIRRALGRLNNSTTRRQEDVTGSAVGRLEQFVLDPLVRRIVTAPGSLDFGDIMDTNGIHLVNLGLYNPFCTDDVRLLGRFMVNDIVAHKFARSDGEDHPVFLLLDEAHMLATEDLCVALNMGRGLGLHCILAHQFLQQLTDEDSNNHLFHSLKNDALTKIIFGQQPVDDLETMLKDVMIDRYDPKKVKDEIYTLETQQRETTRISLSRGWNRNVTHTTGVAYPESETEGESTTISNGVAQGVAEHNSYMHGHGRSAMKATTRAHGRAISAGEANGEGLSSGTGRGVGSTDTSGVSVGETMLPNGEIIETGVDMTGLISSEMATESAGKNRFHTSSTHETHSEIESDTEAEGISVHEAYGEGRTEQQVTSHSRSASQQRSRTKGITPSESDAAGAGVNESETIQPFHEIHQERVLSSRTFYNPEEQLLMHIQYVHELLKGQYLLKVPGKAAVMVQAPQIDEPLVRSRVITRGHERIYQLSGYTPIESLEEEKSIPSVFLPPTAPSADDAWR